MLLKLRNEFKLCLLYVDMKLFYTIYNQRHKFMFLRSDSTCFNIPKNKNIFLRSFEGAKITLKSLK